MSPMTHSEFFRLFVQRKKQELLNPKFIGISEITLPVYSVVHYFPKEGGDIGPDKTEAFISNYRGDVFIDFTPEFHPVVGHGKFAVIDKRKAIQGYRASHYQYNWTRDMNTIWGKKNDLIVSSFGLAFKPWQARASMFVNFETHYNRYSALVNNVNFLQNKSPARHQFFRIDLPVNMPGWSKLLETLDHYIRSFKDGRPVPSSQTVTAVKAESSYWLIDMVAFLLGDYKYSLLSKIDDEAMKNFHVAFVYNSRCLLVNLGLWKEWLDPLIGKGEEAKVIEGKSVHTVYQKRVNAVKRIYLALLNLTHDGIPEEQVEEKRTDQDGRSQETPPASAPVVKGSARVEEVKGRPSDQPAPGQAAGQTENVATHRAPRDLSDVFNGNKGPDQLVDENPGQAGGGDHPEDIEDWTAPVDDKLLEEERVKTVVTTIKDPFKTPISGVELALEERAREGTLTVAEKQFFLRKGTQYRHIELENGQTLEEFMKIEPEVLNSLSEDAKIEGTFNAIEDPSMLRSRAKVLKQGYVKKFLLKDTVGMFVGLQNAGFALNDFKHEVVHNEEGSFHLFGVQYHPVDGEQSSWTIPVPFVDEKDSSFTVDRVKMHGQLQRMELPIRKINKFRVILTSHYDTRLMVQRSQYVSDDAGKWFAKELILKGKEGSVKFSRGKAYNPDLKAPRVYSMVASQFQWVEAKGYRFDFRFAQLVKDNPEFKKFDKTNSFLIGTHDGNPMTIDSYGIIYVDGAEVGTFEDILGINISKMPLEPVIVNIGNYPFPIVVPLCFYFGIDELIKITRATTRSVPMGTRPKLANDEYAIAFNDEYLIFSRREKVPTMIFSGLTRLANTANFSRSDLNDKGIWGPLMADPKVRPTHFREMKNLFELFIDPITKKELIRLGYSDSFHYLLLDAVKLLETDYTRNEVELEEQRIVGYERFAGHVYRELVKSVRRYRNKGNDRRHKMDFNPQSVTQAILKDTSMNLVEEVNPIHQLKDQEELTFGGVGGRNELTLRKRARTQKDSYRGVIGDQNKDSGKVGFVTGITSDAMIADYRGNIAKDEKPSNTSLMSVTGNLSFGSTNDDPKRATYISTQWSQAVSAATYTHNICRTGHELTVAHRTSELYSKVAKDAGKVTSIKNHVMTVTYDDGTTDTYPLGLKIGEASGEYHRHTRTTDLVEGDAFKKGDIIGWDSTWFMRDAFNPGQVALLGGRQVRVALVEDQDTYEDSTAISRQLADEMITPYIKPKRFIVEVEKRLSMKVKPGDDVEYDAILCEVEDDSIAEEFQDNSLVADINRLGIKQIKAPNHGKIIRIEVMYNADKEAMSDSVKKLVETCDKQKRQESEASGDTVFTRRVSSSANVNRPLLSPGKALVTIYIESLDRCTTSDKFVLGNQMKGTAGTIMQHVLKTLDGRIVDMKNSLKGLLNRMVLSLRNKLGGGELSIHVTKMAVKIYRGEK